ncbi:uncharacterized protein LOC130674436 [Microplitis mediator]|uniref:uncharacterized protein LOC130674436 n=1 Tax=Microplitis mediator TaxID=375433 RepID=UPI002553113E|nr:uncharacterized protein LOC130674436 [Microplitis mediator]
MIISYLILSVLATYVASEKLPGRLALTDKACEPSFGKTACLSTQDKCLGNGIVSYEYICTAPGNQRSNINSLTPVPPTEVTPRKLTEKLNDACELDVDCQGLKYASCQGMKCHCKPGYVENKGTCFATLNARCTNTPECIGKFVECRHNSCECIRSHYQVGSNCYQNANNPGDQCYSNVGCFGVPKKWCGSNGDFCIDESGIDCDRRTHKCVCPQGYVDEKTKCVKYARY